MGVYNTYGELEGQLKIGDDLRLHHYSLGDEVDIPDGVYVTYVNVIVIVEGVFVAEFKALITKWGGFRDPEDIIDPVNPLNVYIDQVVEKA